MTTPATELIVDFALVAPDAPVAFSVRNEATGDGWSGGSFRTRSTTSRWPTCAGIWRTLLNALVNAVNGATWVSIHHDGGGIGYSIHAGQVLVADVPSATAQRLARPHQQPRHGRRPPRRCQLPGGN